MLQFLGGSAILRRRVSSMGSYHLENNAPSPGNMEASG
ncbi:unnamed protein product [Musa acuminata subsp. malaccensis]|uniref:(wild Malaysian banana) hypothetical protein n=1 Tax=Musa acuminata subsp. malaccensis TaxID=214687 RepID=A0A804JEC9_MUSAM|nr:unnamed protein product [Musa acuminata subsp. malaccensis]